MDLVCLDGRGKQLYQNMSLVWGHKDAEDSHADHILDVEILEGGHVGVVTFVVLQNHLLNDAVQQKPVLYRVSTPLICTEQTGRPIHHTF